MKYPIANNYIETLERVTRQLFEMAFTERHPEPLAYEEIQTMIGEVLMLNIMELYREAVNSDSLRLYKSMFSDILSNPHVVNGTVRKRITILPYYPPGVTLVSDSGNKITLSKEKREQIVPGTDEEGKKVERTIVSHILVGTETDAEGKKVAEHEIISYLFDGDKITKRLLNEGWIADNKSEKNLIFFFSQLNQLQEAIFERWEDVRVMFDYIEKPNLKKYKRDFDTALLEKEGKEKPEAWKAKATSPIVTVTHDEIRLAERRYRHKTSSLSLEELDKRYNALFSYLSPGGVSKGFKGCLREGVDTEMLHRALRGCVLKEISNRNRIDVLYCAFCVYANYYIFEGDQKKYIEDLDRQILEMNLRTNKGKKPEIKLKIENFFK